MAAPDLSETLPEDMRPEIIAFVSRINNQFPGGRKVGPPALDPELLNEPLVEFMVVIPNGTVHEALHRLFSDIARYADGRTGSAYWRMYPEGAMHGASKIAKAYARLAITSTKIREA